MVTSKPKHNGQVDDDILQCKKDVLRARDIMPPYDKSSKDTTESTDTAERGEEQIKPRKENSAETSSTAHGKAGIPKFDLAEEILAEQRRISAIRRTGPGKKTEARKGGPEIGPTSYTIGQPVPTQPYQQQIIAEIVARDIERLCRGGYSVNSGW